MASPSDRVELSSRSPGAFATTHWSVVLGAGLTDAPQVGEALETLCGTYWYPLYAFVRRKSYPPEDAKDLTQAFFERFLAKRYVRDVAKEKGRFRTFLLTAFQRFLCDEFDRSTAAKRGGGRPRQEPSVHRGSCWISIGAIVAPKKLIRGSGSWKESPLGGIRAVLA
jgi:hypothetical protein